MANVVALSWQANKRTHFSQRIHSISLLSLLFYFLNVFFMKKLFHAFTQMNRREKKAQTNCNETPETLSGQAGFSIDAVKTIA